MYISRILVLGLLGLGVAGLASRAMAQTDAPPAAETAQQSGRLEEIVVSARRRSESLQDVPVTVAPITKSQLENNDASTFSNLAELAPQVMIGSTATGTGAILSIRGISSGATKVSRSISTASS